MRYASPKSYTLSLFASIVVTACAASAVAQEIRYSTEHRDHEHTLPQTVSAPVSALMKAKMRAGRVGVSMAVADFDADGTRDLITGYAAEDGGVLLLQRGSSLATAPTPSEWSLLARGELVAPYVEKAETIDLPVRPDLLQTADINGMGHADLLAATKGGRSVYLLAGRGDGTFLPASELRLGGSVQSLATWTDAASQQLIVAGVCGPSGCGLQFLNREGKTLAFVPSPGAVTAILDGAIEGGSRQDLVFVANERPMVLDGDTALSRSPVIEKLNVSHAAAIAVGSFVADRRGYQQIAVLDAGATLHVLTRAGIDSSVGTSADRLAAQRARLQQVSMQSLMPRHSAMAVSTVTAIGLSAASTPVKRTGSPWSEVETLSNIGPGGDDVLFFSAHLNAGGNDDLAAIAGTQITTVAHTLERDGTVLKTTPVVAIDSTASPVRAAMATRVSADARSGIVTLSPGGQPLTIAIPPTNRTMTVNTTSDATPTTASLNACTNGTAGCTLRAAITQANKDRAANGVSKVDVINIPAGTYTISAVNINSSGTTQNPDYLGSVNYHYEIDASMNLAGAGSASTIINGNNIDQVFSVDYGSFYSTGEDVFAAAVQDTFFSGMTIENGRNPNDYDPSFPGSETSGCAASSQGCNFYGGNVSWLVEGASNLVMNNVIITGGSSPYSGGGGVSVFFDASSSGPAGPLEIDNSSITNNTVSDTLGGNGGGIEVEGAGQSAYSVPLTLMNDIITGNTTTDGGGGGVAVDDNTNAVIIAGGSIQGNTTAGTNGFGGGLFVTGPLTMAGTTVSGNAGRVYGGGLYVLTNSYGGTITASTFTGNSITGSFSGGGVTNTSDGAGVCVDGAPNAGQGLLTVSYSRFYGNTGGTTAGTGLAVGCNNSGTSYSAVTATDNWWGCNGAATGTGCDTAHVGNASNGSLSLTPYTTLTLNLSPSSLALGGSITATGSLGQDSGGTIYTAANDTAYLATPISAFTLTKTNTVTYNPSATAFGTGVVASNVSNAAATATATTNSAGSGTATLTVDGQTLTSTYAILSPPTISESFNVSPVAPGTHSVVTFTVGNPSSNTASLTGVGFTDTLPTNLLVFTTPGASTTCSGGTVTATAGSSSISLSGATIASGATCTVSVSVYSNTAGSYLNTTGNVTSSNGGSGATGSATLTVSNTRGITIISPTIHMSEPLNGGPNAYITAYFDFAGTQAPAGAVTFAVTNSSGVSVGALSGQTCTVKALHTNCTIAYSAAGVPNGNYKLTVTQAADSFYVAISGTGFVTVAP